jgi:hypothetical protein
MLLLLLFFFPKVFPNLFLLPLCFLRSAAIIHQTRLGHTESRNFHRRDDQQQQQHRGRSSCLIGRLWLRGTWRSRKEKKKKISGTRGGVQKKFFSFFFLNFIIRIYTQRESEQPKKRIQCGALAPTGSLWLLSSHPLTHTHTHTGEKQMGVCVCVWR